MQKRGLAIAFVGLLLLLWMFARLPPRVCVTATSTATAQRHDWCPQRNDRALQGPINCSAIAGRDFIVFSAGRGHGGMGDRVLSLVDLLVVGHLVNRTVLYDWTDELPLWTYWQPGAYEVRWAKYKHCFDEERDVRRSNYMNRHAVLERVAVEPLQRLFRKRVEIVHKNVAWIGLLSSTNPYHSSTLFRWWQGDVYPWWRQAWQCVIRPSATLLALAAPYERVFRTHDVIGLQIRLNNPQQWGDDNTRNEHPHMRKIVEAFVYCSEQRFARHASRPRKYLVLSDLAAVHALVAERVGGDVLTVEGPIVHVDRDGARDGFARIMLETHLLSLTAGNVIGRASNFGRVGALGNPTLPIGLNFVTDIGTSRPIDRHTCVPLHGRDVIRKGDPESADPSRVRGILES